MPEKENCEAHTEGINCDFKSGTSTAILGTSGSGKTSLLNYMSSRTEDNELKVNGELFVNGHKVASLRQIKPRTAHLYQKSVVYTELTPREQLLYSAKLAGVPDPEKKTEEIIEVYSYKAVQTPWLAIP